MKPNLSLRLTAFACVLWLIAFGMLASSAPPSTSASSQPSNTSTQYASASAEQLLNSDGTINLKTGYSGALDLRGFDVTLDSKRGPILTSKLPNQSSLSSGGADNSSGASSNNPQAASWMPLPNQGLNGSVYAFAVLGPDVYVGGNFTQTTDGAVKNLNYIAKYSTTTNTWSALANKGLVNVGCVNTKTCRVKAFAVVGTDLYVGGEFNQTADGIVTNLNGIAKYDTTSNTWSALANKGLSCDVNALAAIGNDLYVGGCFTWTYDLQVMNLVNIAKYNTTSNAWSALANNGLSEGVFALAVSGSDLYVGGYFGLTADGQVKNLFQIAKYSGGTWSPLSNKGLDNAVYAIAVNGSDLYVGGQFTQTFDGAVTNMHGFARYSGGTWSVPNQGLNGVVYGLAVLGADVYVGGFFSKTADNQVTNLNGIAKLSGGSWSELPNKGLAGEVYAVAGVGSDIYVGGYFGETADHQVTNLNGIAKLGQGCPLSGTAKGSQGPQQECTPPIKEIALEVTQGIQNWKADVPLIDGRATYVRAHLKSTTGKDIAGVQGTLSGTRDGASLGAPLTPEYPLGSLTVKSDPNRLVNDDSFLFRLPTSWLSGTIILTFSSPNHADLGCNNFCKAQVTFTKTAPENPAVKFVWIPWIGRDGETRRVTYADSDRVAEEIKAAFPIIDLDLELSNVPTLDQQPNLTSLTDIVTLVDKKRKADDCVTDAGCKTYYIGLIASPTRDDSNPQQIGLTRTPRKDPTYGDLGDVSVGYFSSPLNLVHEFGHGLGRDHVQYDDDETDDPIDKEYPFSILLPNGNLLKGSISDYDGTVIGTADWAYFGFDRIGRRPIRPSTADLMAQHPTKWTSSYTWEAIRKALVARYGSPNSPRAAIAREAATAQPVVLISGIVSPAQNSGSITSLYDFTGFAEVPTAGTYAIRFEGPQGQVLATFPFRLASNSNGQFVLLLPRDPNTARIVLLGNSQVLDSRQASGSPPSASIIYPNGGESLAGPTATFRWTASDADGDALRYIVQYSTDAGSTWQTLATDWTSTHLDVNLSTLAGTNQGLLRVLASDGFYTTQAQSSKTFTVARNAPQALIEGPADNSLFVGNQILFLEGRAYDLQDGQLSGSQLVWSSSQNGVLGTGRLLEVNASTLATGTHVITLTATNSYGLSSSATTTVQIYRTRPTLPASLSVTPDQMEFWAPVGSGQTYTDTLAIRNEGDGSLTWSASADQSWIRLSASTGTAPSNMVVSTDATGLAIGKYYGHITLISSGNASSPNTIPVILDVTPVATPTPTPTATPTPTPTPTQTSVQFNSANYSVNEGDGSVSITVIRSGDASGTATVDFATSDGTASQRNKYITTSGTLKFAAGETSKTFNVLIIDEAYVEGSETVNLTLSNPNGARLGSPSQSVLTIIDNDTGTPVTNPIDNGRFFVHQHYYDFLNRIPDQGGYDYWTNQIGLCGTDQGCIIGRRISVSAAYFTSQEFQDTGNFIYLFYKASFGQKPTYAQFMQDRSRVIGGDDLEANRKAFADSWVQRAEFLQRYPASLDGPHFIDALLQTLSQGSGVDLSGQKQALMSDYAANGSRARILRQVVDNSALKASEYNSAFVLMQYFGYLRRDPDTDGYQFWLRIMNGLDPSAFKGMTCSFITSREYQERFSSVVNFSNADCGRATP